MIKKTIAALAFLTISLQAGAQEVVQMDKALFLKEVYDYENEPQWKYKGDRPAIIDLYADWCGPCRSIAPIMAELAKEYAGQIVVYKVNVDKERELATLFVPAAYRCWSSYRRTPSRGCFAGQPTRRPTRR